MSDSIFTKIINREIPAFIPYEDDQHIVIFDINPRAFGHLLVIPKQPYRWFLDMPEPEYAQLMKVAQQVAKQLKDATEAEFIQVGIVGDEVPHVHVHLIPRSAGDDTRISAFNETKSKELSDTLATALA
ncbi:TPA: HIT family protein [Candidatus Saccharibacteria bacterium]|nr:HIT family protein [Candidatus Saccharibacteria bacterium]HIO87808.1 HIT family protein [Candidatus Saccharibacteria bacterium]